MEAKAALTASINGPQFADTRTRTHIIFLVIIVIIIVIYDEADTNVTLALIS